MLPRLTNPRQAFCILVTMSGTVTRDGFADAGGSPEQKGVLYLLSSSSIVASKRMAFFLFFLGPHLVFFKFSQPTNAEFPLPASFENMALA